MENIQGTLYLKGENKAACIYDACSLNVLSFIIIFLQGKMDFLLTTVFLEIMKAGGYKRDLSDIT